MHDCPSEELESLTRTLNVLTRDFTDLKAAHDALKARVTELERRQAEDFDISEGVQSIAENAAERAAEAKRDAEILDRRLNEMNVYTFAFKAGRN